MKIIKVETGYLKENCYILRIDNDALVIDPGNDYKKIKNNLKDLNVLGILITHKHFDHIGALEEILKDYNVSVYEYDNLKETKYIIKNFQFEVIFNPGHSIDSVSYFFSKEKVMFVGDFIFKDSIGRCDLKGGNINDMKKSINKIKEYENIILYPGHGESTTIDYEKQNNPYFLIV